MPSLMRADDPRPLRARVISALIANPQGLSTNQVAALLGDSRYTVGSILSKMRLYGGPVEATNIKHTYVWRFAPSKVKAAPGERAA